MQYIVDNVYNVSSVIKYVITVIINVCIICCNDDEHIVFGLLDHAIEVLDDIHIDR
jgi:hypothetical protein